MWRSSLMPVPVPETLLWPNRTGQPDPDFAGFRYPTRARGAHSQGGSAFRAGTVVVVTGRFI
jgi:hypothetical protein